MSSLYIHIPFCKTRCIYCDFYSNTQLEYKAPYIRSLLQEMELRREAWQGQQFDTLYFGGGTPSLFEPAELQQLFKGIHQHFTLSDNPEITIEVNPDDLTDDYISALKHLPFNRISIGIQSFNDNELQFLNRRHTAQEAIDVVKRCQSAGFDNISIDIMYGLPMQTTDSWLYTINQAIQLDVAHVSAYNLSYEQGTPIHRMMENKEIQPVDDDINEQYYRILTRKLKNAGYIHYEISNFARRSALYPSGRISLHNSSYWNGTHYLGLGPSAHSYDGKSRSWNIASLTDYINAVQENPEALQEVEILNENQKYNDYLITRLRTRWGISLDELRKEFGKERENQFLEKVKCYFSIKKLKKRGDNVKISADNFFISDAIIRELIV